MACLTINRADSLTTETGVPRLSDLPPEARQNLVDFLNGDTEQLSGLIGEEIYDRASPGLLLLRSPAGDRQGKMLYAAFNINHGAHFIDSLDLHQKFNVGDQRLSFQYSVPLERGPYSPEALAQVIQNTEKALEQWLARFCDLNGIEAPRITWQ